MQGSMFLVAARAYQLRRNSVDLAHFNRSIFAVAFPETQNVPRYNPFYIRHFHPSRASGKAPKPPGIRQGKESNLFLLFPVDIIREMQSYCVETS
jgi:hypothetical protein